MSQKPSLPESRHCPTCGNSQSFSDSQSTIVDVFAVEDQVVVRWSVRVNTSEKQSRDSDSNRGERFTALSQFIALVDGKRG
jgi:hypothetical protein